MFCPSCGIEDRQSNQYCRACGTDLRRVKTAVAAPDRITASAVSARGEIGQAIAAKIRETKTANELAVVAEEILPQIEKFLESPEQKRLRRMRTGVILAGIGLGTTIGISLVSLAMADPDVIFLAALGAVTFFLGIAFILNGIFLTVPRTEIQDKSAEAVGQAELDEMNFRELSEPATVFSSVTENTTKHLKEKKVHDG